MAKILVIEDDLTFSQLLEGFLKKNGHEADLRHDVKSGIKALDQQQYDLLLVDYRLPDGTGLEVLTASREKSYGNPAIIMTSFNDVRTAVEAMRSGAFDYITKPVNPDELLMRIGEALAPKKDKSFTPHSSAEFIQGSSPQAAKLKEYVDLVAPTDMSVIIQGESGTGKEYFARAIHQRSKRSQKPFIAIDCGVLSKELAVSELFGHVKGAFTGALTDKKGKFEVAGGGTVFLDEIGNLDYEVQVNLLRALQEKVVVPLGSNRPVSVDIRIIAATNDDLLTSVSQGKFREDLYHRLNEFKMHLLPLRARGKDLGLFTKHFIEVANSELNRDVTRLSDEALDVFQRYDWPGNLRELKNVIKRMVLLSKTREAGIESLPDEMMFSITQSPKVSGTDLKAINEMNEKALIMETLQKVKYNKSMAAKLLNIDRKTLYSKIEKYDLE
ncbi:sigma-54-dependent transcriptional regulator [Paradesertivirga mongoliensis]|uniref:Sigma-54-dependent transcriptional regulator n=2 Tax=Paradesertivirga mongoliensis TaxID=2100740 RepID=A0ABW4ZHK7_9SPHI|nr:sigma-54 dependent transcriptional regulator [Pedobacter mongoliensis]